MKSVTTLSTYLAATSAAILLRANGLYSCISGCKSRGYEILVRDSQESAAKQLLTHSLTEKGIN